MKMPLPTAGDEGIGAASENVIMLDVDNAHGAPEQQAERADDHPQENFNFSHDSVPNGPPMSKGKAATPMHVSIHASEATCGRRSSPLNLGGGSGPSSLSPAGMEPPSLAPIAAAIDRLTEAFERQQEKQRAHEKELSGSYKMTTTAAAIDRWIETFKRDREKQRAHEKELASSCKMQ